MVVEQDQFAVSSTLLFDLSAFGVVGEVLLPETRSRSRAVKVALCRVSAVNTWPGSRAAASLAWRICSARSAISEPATRIPHRADVRRRVDRGRVDL